MRELAGCAAAELRASGVPARLVPVLRRGRGTRDSAGLDAAERRRNLAGRFRVVTTRGGLPDGTLVLVDDSDGLALDAVGSPHLKVVMDGANIFHAGELGAVAATLDEAFALLGGDIALVHAKDLDHDGDAGHLPTGHGLLDYDGYLRGLHEVGYTGPVVLHGLAEAQVAGCVRFLEGRIAALLPV